MPRILFVCTANQYRSPLAAALLTKKLQMDGYSHGWTIESAGTWTAPGQHVPPDVLAVARSMGLDLHSHLTRQVDQNILSGCDLVLVMERGHKEALSFEFPMIQQRVYLLSEVADGLEYDVADPAHSDVTMIEIAEEINRLINKASSRIYQLARPSAS